MVHDEFKAVVGSSVCTAASGVAPGHSSSTSPLTVDPWSQNSLCSWYSPLPSGIFHGTLVFTGTQDEKLEYQEFPGGPMVEIPGFHC